ncbi:aldehyde dehydrogenase family protein [Streptomyces sp. NPDC002513]
MASRRSGSAPPCRSRDEHRVHLFHRAHRLLLERADDIVETMTLESGKPLGEARGEFQLSVDFFLRYAEQIAHLHGTYAHGSRGAYRVVTTHQPAGPCLLITPWDFPLLMIARKAGAAPAAGCTVVVKSAKETPLTCALFVQALHAAGFPAGVVNLIHTTTSSKVSAVLMADSRLRKVSFTGSTSMGSTLLSQAAANIASASRELGGDGPFIVLDDVDLDLRPSRRSCASSATPVRRAWRPTTAFPAPPIVTLAAAA